MATCGYAMICHSWTQLNTVSKRFKRIPRAPHCLRTALRKRRAATSCRKRSAETSSLQEIVELCGVHFRHERNAEECRGLEEQGTRAQQSDTAIVAIGLETTIMICYPRSQEKEKKHEGRTSCKRVSKLCTSTSTVLQTQMLHKSCCPKVQQLLFARDCYCSKQLKILLFW